MTETPKHSPAPWSETRSPTGAYYIVAADGSMVARMDDLECVAERQLANRALLKAAPKLLEALAEAERFIAGFEDDEAQEPSINPMLERIRTIIAEAKGRTNAQA